MSLSKFGKCCVGMITAPLGKAETLAEVLLTEKLVACVNIVPQVKSMYWWEGKICRDQEELLIVKTRSELKYRIVDCVKKNHEYSVPEVIFMDITDGNEEYLSWIISSVAKPPISHMDLGNNKGTKF